MSLRVLCVGNAVLSLKKTNAGIGINVGFGGRVVGNQAWSASGEPEAGKPFTARHGAV